ncbi:MAG TPA: 50S ribosomal protein L27 [Candidatus Saccharimonadales bacterium]|jgi:large subunit ribosomal protein L27|nr:50S ribosomal protein L27 [Candidatus Saccharimonadales bacterium]
MAHVKAGGTSKNTHDSPGQRLGVKLYANQQVKTGQTIIRQVGLTKRSGSGTALARNFTIYATKDGIVQFKKRKVRLFTGKTVRRTEVSVK